MIEELRSKLSELSEKIQRARRIDVMLQSLQEELDGLEQHERELKAILQKEEADVEKLKRTSAASLLYSLLGKKDAMLSQEKREAYAAKLKCDAAVTQSEDCRRRINELRREKGPSSSCAREYERVFEELRQQLLEDPDYARELSELERQRGENTAQLRELDEAVVAGKAALAQIGSIQSSLGSAEGWGTWDLLGGGLISDMAKHSHLDDAQAAAEHLQLLLSRFRTELADVRVDGPEGAVNVEGFLRFADYFFDGLIADWTVLSRIRDSQESVSRVDRQVREAMRKLDSLRNSRSSEKARIEQLIAELITRA